LQHNSNFSFDGQGKSIFEKTEEIKQEDDDDEAIIYAN